jgi:hypothetical protein
MGLFGPSKDEIWSQIAADIGGEYVDGGFFGKDVLAYKHGEWQILLDTYTVSTGKSSTTYTRMRTPFENLDGLQFKIYREGFFSSIGKMFGAQDIEIGDRFFDDSFIIKGNRERKIKEFLLDAEVKSLIHAQPRIHLEIKDNEGWFGPAFPEGVDELCFHCVGVIKETHVLKSLFDLFTVALARMVEVGTASERGPNVTLK